MKIKCFQSTVRLTRLLPLFLFLISILLPGSAIYAATVPTGFTDSTVVSGLSNPTAMAFAPDSRLFVTQQSGALRVIKNGALLATPFLTVSVNASGERGLLGIAFDPDFAANQFVYVYYTTNTPSVHNRISRFTAAGDVAAAGSELVILELDNLSSATNHNGGAIHFGSDGKLYAAVGDNANSANAQSFANMHGKMLRLNKDGTIPADNPFYSTATGNNRSIWALGLRNPFTFSFQRGVGRMFINDVGQGAWEEVNDGIAGSNYGWSFCEGVCNPPDARYRDPVYAYQNDSSTCAITGGAFYNSPVIQFPTSYAGDYFYADFCAGWIRKLDSANYNSFTEFATGIANPVDLQVSADGSLYYLARGAGSVGRIQYTNAAGFEADVASRPNGDGLILSDDVIQVQRFQIGLDQPYLATEFQRADSAPLATRGDGFIQSDDIVQAQRYQIGLDARQNGSGATAPSGQFLAAGDFASELIKTGFKLWSAESAAAAPREVRVQSVTANPGQEIVVNIVADAVGDENAYGFRLNFNPSLLTLKERMRGLGGFLCNDTVAGQLTCSVRDFPDNQPGSDTDLIGEIPAGNNQLLLKVTFTVSPSAAPGAIPITLSGVNASNDRAESLTPFTETSGAVTVLAPTAAAGEISGRVVTASGRAIGRARVSLTDQNGATKTTTTNPFGYYRFGEVEVGQTYVISAAHKRYRFEAKVLSINESVAAIILTAIE